MKKHIININSITKMVEVANALSKKSNTIKMDVEQFKELAIGLDEINKAIEQCHEILSEKKISMPDEDRGIYGLIERLKLLKNGVQ